jgi:hypothetical protein
MPHQIPARRLGTGHELLQTTRTLRRDLTVAELGDQIVNFLRDSVRLTSHCSYLLMALSIQ